MTARRTTPGPTITPAPSRTMTSGATVTFERVEDMPEGLAAQYELLGVAVTVKIRDDLLTMEGARVLEELWTEVLSKGWRRADELRLVQGDGGAG